MPFATATSIVDFLLGLALAPTDQESGNRFSLEGLALGARPDGALEVRIQRLAAASLRVESGPLMLEVEHLAVHRLVAVVGTEGGALRVRALEAAGAELSGLKVQAPVARPPQPAHGSHARPARGGGSASGAAWSLGPLAGANGSVRAEILDAHLLFDADVTVPIREGLVNFDDATVEHVGPDSRMGVSRLGLYVDAPNGRSYLYQFPSAPVTGVEYERRDAMAGPWGKGRGHLQLQAFGEALLRQPAGGRGPGLTEQARLLFDRTAMSGEVRLGDGRVAVPGVQGDTAGRAEGRNVVRLHSPAVGRGLTLDVPSLLVRSAVLGSGNRRIECDEVAGALMLRLFVADAQVRLAFELATLGISGLHLQRMP